MSLVAGNVLQSGRYRIESPLGQGGFGVTYRATQVHLAQTVVIKALQAHLRQSDQFPRFHQQFLAEARLLARFQHPSIVRVMDYFEEAGLPFIVMEYIPGRSLASLTRPGKPLPEAHAVYYIRQIASALSTMHAQGILHRDVTPSNMIRRQGTHRVILIDFGTARDFRGETLLNPSRALSVHYAPPEQRLPPAHHTPAMDVHALAATLYHLLAGCPPVEAPLRDRIALPCLQQFQPNLTPGLEEAILQGLRLDAKQRPSSMQDWLALLPSGLPSHQSKPKSVSQFHKPVSPRLAETSSPDASNVITAKPPIHPPSVVKPPSSSAVPSEPGPSMLPTQLLSTLSPSNYAHHFYHRLLKTGVIASGVGVGIGLVVRLIVGLQPSIPFLQSEQSFPASPWPGSVPTQTPASTADSHTSASSGDLDAMSTSVENASQVTPINP
jgi:serine/threonine protein kinase